jgi:hypothetical protein
MQKIYANKNFTNAWSYDFYSSTLWPNESKISYKFFREIFIDYSLDMFLENYYDFSIYQLPAMGNYSFSDNYVFSLLGNSWLWNRYYYNGFNINDSFFSGRTLHKLPLVGKNININAINGEINFLNNYHENLFYVQINNGYLGPEIPFYNLFTDGYSQQSPQLRKRIPPEERRRTQFALEFFSKQSLSKKEGIWWFDTYFAVRNRLLLDFNEKGDAREYPENYLQFTFGGELITEDKNNLWGFFITFIARENLYGEFYYHEEETAGLSDFMFSLYYKKNNFRFSYGHIININNKIISKKNDYFSRNLFDVSGQGLDPFYPSQNVFSLSQHSYINYVVDKLPNNFLKIKANFNNSINVLNPLKKHYQHPVYFKSPQDQLALYVTDWKSSSFVYVLLQNDISLLINKTEKEGFRIDAKIGLDLSGIILPEDNVITVRP